MRVWGCPAYALKPPNQQRKMDSRVLVGTYVGYAADEHGLRILSPITGRIHERRDVVVDETLPEGLLRGSGLPRVKALPDAWDTDGGSSSGSASTGDYRGGVGDGHHPQSSP